jgi:Protein of unknown function (DUF1553)/Protein of unknown function (DUF1549)
MRCALMLCLALGAVGAAARASHDPVAPFEAPSFSTPQCRIDDLVFARLAKEKVPAALPCSDVVFVRRVFIDLIGTLPTPDEVAGFLADKSSDKRAKLVERLFEREEFADFWAMRWSDVLCVKAEFPINLWPNPAQGYHHYLRNCVRSNVPVNRLARDLLTANGSNMRVPESNFLRAVQKRDPHTLAAAASQTFMGVRRESWTSAELDSLAVFFSRVGYKTTSEWKEEIVFFDISKPAPALPVTMPDGRSLSIPPDSDPRQVFAGWLLRPENPWFARCMANRMWFWLLGRGIVDEADDFRRDNPPSHPELLAYLSGELASHGWDMRHLIRLIVNSRTYQLSPIPPADSRAPALFASYPIRRMDAEVLIDALCAVTGSTETYSSLIPEPFTFLPEGTRALAVPDGSISSSFLELFGRPSRDSGLLSERNPNPSAGQRLHFLNSSHLRNKVEQSATLREMLRSGKSDDAATRLYLLILSRPPTDGERRIFHMAVASTSDRRSAFIDITWALLNTTEFLCRH